MSSEDTNTSTASFPSVGELFRESWETFKKSLLSLFIFNIIGLVGILAIVAVIVGIAIFSGLGAAFTAGQSNAALTGGIVLIAAIAIFVAIVACIVLGLILQVGQILIINTQGKIGIGEAIRKGLSLALPVFLVSLLVSIIVFGGFFVFILPGFLFALFFAFAIFDVVIEDSRWTNALRASMSLVTHNFGDVFGRFLLLVVIQIGAYFLFSFFPNIISQFNEIAGGILYLIGVIPNILLGWFCMVYMLVLYKQAKAVKGTGQSGLLWVGIVAGIGWILALIWIIVFGALLAALISSSPEGMLEKAKNTGARKTYGALTQQDASYLASDVFKELNAYRKQKGLTQFTADSRLCAYAQRRVGQLTEGQYDDGKGFYEDNANQSIVNAYFTDYVNNGETYYPISSGVTAEDIVTAWVGDGSNKRTVNVPGYDSGCVRASTTALILETAAKK